MLQWSPYHMCSSMFSIHKLANVKVSSSRTGVHVHQAVM